MTEVAFSEPSYLQTETVDSDTGSTPVEGTLGITPTLVAPNEIGAGGGTVYSSGNEFVQMANNLLLQWQKDETNNRRFIRERMFPTPNSLSGHKTWNGEAPTA